MRKFIPFIVFLVVLLPFAAVTLYYGIPNNWQLGNAVEVNSRGWVFQSTVGVVVFVFPLLGLFAATCASISVYLRAQRTERERRKRDEKLTNQVEQRESARLTS